MKIWLAQVDPKVGDLTGNAEKIRQEMRRAREGGAALVVFPELALVGYPPRDLLEFPCVVEKNQELLRSLALEAKGVAALVGFVERNPAPHGALYANAAALLRDGKVEAVYRKQLLPVYDVFDERRFFEPGTEPLFFSLEGRKCAVTICEDLWNRPGYLDRPYPTNPALAVKGKGVELLFNLSASPFHLGKPEIRRRLFAEIAVELGCHVLLCNQVGGNDELLFDGCSLVLSPAGDVLASGPAFREATLVLDLNRGGEKAAWPGREEEWLRLALAEGLRDYGRKCGTSSVVIGLSGGVDSSVVAALAAEAFGPKNVIGVGLPTKFTGAASREDAETLASRLGIEYRVLSVESMRSKFLEEWKGWFGSAPKALTQENVQPRLRMAVLMAIANERGAFLLNTSNKSEIATGYSTLYGDTAGALAVLGDLVKSQVYDLARLYNEKGEIIPERVLTRAPTAELREGQTDQETLPPYPVLDGIVRAAVEKGGGEEQLRRQGFDAAAVATYKRLHGPSEYKRHQLPPVLRVSPHAFGFGRRMPIAAARPC